MKKFVIYSLIGIAVIGVLAVIVIYVQLRKTKSFSPEDNIVYSQDDLSIKVFYNRPYKKERQVFGALVPYDKVWRTGANEATTFETNKDLIIEGKTLKAGKYSLWTIPRQEIWTVIFNSEYGQWGINSKGEANRQPEKDVLSIDVSSVQQDQIFEQFTISFEKTGEDLEMVLAWDKTLVALPITFKQMSSE
ncbi:DUF2911 domain-containing protein [Chryseosolibacter indicus]|uniref:DUF2911 domain-containing protein n=1 Tax=Chryseosolibacter indicus TaxID=2782351 RepID=A0ABS5VS05_9BACT|nr:DUF2911 domain-containing protein [Chryseosolibacter indicus]MBT1704215.1 DUF2911 domain-containing protein [Chryseosolibacter indicus]